MAIHKKMEAAINNQINQEMANAYNYLAMASFFENLNLQGFAKWMYQQRQEELVHALKLYHYLLDRRGRVELAAVAKPKVDYKGVREVFEAALKAEQQNTASINACYKLALQLDDYATQSHLQWFVDEQVEEEKIVEDVLGLLDAAGEDKGALLVLNRQLAERPAEGGH